MKPAEHYIKLLEEKNAEINKLLEMAVSLQEIIVQKDQKQHNHIRYNSLLKLSDTTPGTWFLCKESLTI